MGILYTAGFVIQLHLLCAVLAVPLGAVMLSLPKGTRMHKGLGKVWTVLVGTSSISSFFITDINKGTFSYIHLLSVFTLIMLCWAIWAIRHGRVRSHRITMIATYFGGLIGAGIGAFAPGRLLHTLVFGG